MTIMEASHLRLEGKLDQRLDRIESKVNDLSGAKLSFTAIIGFLAWAIGVAMTFFGNWVHP